MTEPDATNLQVKPKILYSSPTDFISQNRADRLVKRVRNIRATLEPWQNTPPVKQLDDQLHGSGLYS